MLSTMAENLYWMGRYLERAENTARLVRAMSRVRLDAPPDAIPGWRVLLNVMGLGSKPPQADGFGEAEVIRLLVDDQTNPGAIVPSIRQARENAERVRDWLPLEVWDAVEELHLCIARHGQSGQNGTGAEDFLRAVIRGRMCLSGLLHETMSRDTAYHFIRIGEMVERVDMTSRIVDLTTVAEYGLPAATPPARDALWHHVLVALSAEQMYRRHAGTHIEPHQVLTFLFDDVRFPRALRFALNALATALAELPDPSRPLRAIRQAERLLKRHSDATQPEMLHDLIDALQIRLAEVHKAIEERYLQRWHI